jgi:enoyl-CoA hydratase/carnithine racemase
LTKEAFWAAVDGNSLDSVISMEDRNQVLTVMNGDLAEGAQAFLEKRKPRFGAKQHGAEEANAPPR